MIVTFLSRVVIAFILLIATSLSYVQADFQTTESLKNKVISLFGSAYSAQEIVTKKNFSLVSRTLKKEHPSLKSLALFSRSGVDFNFAITKLCTLHTWPVRTKKYENCRSFAKQNAFLDLPLLSNPSNPQKYLLTYEQLATLLARSVEYKKNTEIQSATRLLQKNSTSTSSLNLSPVIAPAISNGGIPLRSIPTNSRGIDTDTYDVRFFGNVQLDEPLPKDFYVGEVYMLKGVVLNKSVDSIFAFTCLSSSNCDVARNFSESINGSRFSIPLYFDTPGTFNLGLIPGHSGESRLAEVLVANEEVPQTNDGSVASNLAVQYSRGTSTFAWNPNGFSQNEAIGRTAFSRLVIYQGNNRVDFIFRQPTIRFAPASSYFKDFSTGSAFWTVIQNNAASTPQSIPLIRQNFYKQENKLLTITAFNDYFPEARSTALEFQGIAKTSVSKTVAITLPNGKVKKIVVSESDFNPGERIVFSVPLTEPGSYIFEINDTLGSAVLNAPVYVGSGIPLLPDFFALNEQSLDAKPLTDLSAARITMLQLINKDRADHGLSGVSLDSSLNVIAQAHSDSMMRNNFFSHTDTQGNSPDDRRRAASIPTPIRENLGKSTSIEHVEAGLMRSPVHRDALLDDHMKRVGIGIAKSPDGYFLITQNFSGNQLSENDLRELKRELLTQANNVRASRNAPSLAEDATGSAAALEWARAMASNNFFSLTAPGNCTNCPALQFTEVVRSFGIRSAFEVYIVRASDESALVDQLITESTATDPGNTRISIGLSVGNFGEVYMVVLYF